MKIIVVASSGQHYEVKDPKKFILICEDVEGFTFTHTKNIDEAWTKDCLERFLKL